jgi:hypothetical protein
MRILCMGYLIALTLLMQGLVPGRAPEWVDFFRGLLGILIGVAICWSVAVVHGSPNQA